MAECLEKIGDLCAKADGVIMDRVNFQALNLIKDKYDSNIQSIYIDPPYNTNASEIIYKNGFKHSSWLSLLDSRFDLTKKLMNKDSLICVTIDDGYDCYSK